MSKSTPNLHSEEVRTLRTGIKDMVLTLEVLDDDLRLASSRHHADPGNQFWRRTTIRCLLALIEASMWNFKAIAHNAARLTNVQLTDAEIQFITEQKPADGKRAFPSFRDNVKRSFCLLAKVHRFDAEFPANADFDCLCKTHDLRSRLMHPKTPFDPRVTDSEMGDARRGVSWLNEEYVGNLMSRCSSALPHIYPPPRS